jgi:hypothetical protein
MTAARPPRARPLRLTITLTANWRRAWRMLSVQAAALACGFGLLPPDQQAALLAAVGVPEHRLPLALGLLFLAARLIGQPGVEDAAPATPPVRAEPPTARAEPVEAPATPTARAEPVEAPATPPVRAEPVEAPAATTPHP